MELDPSLSLADSLRAILDPKAPTMSNLSNAARVLFEKVPGTSWAGFYLLEEAKNALFLGPYQGPLACIRIPMGKGVCGTAALRKSSLLVEDVHAFPGHIACSASTKSELVVPLLKNGEVLGVIDLDSDLPHNFTKQDQRDLESAALILAAIL